MTTPRGDVSLLQGTGRVWGGRAAFLSEPAFDGAL